MIASRSDVNGFTLLCKDDCEVLVEKCIVAINCDHSVAFSARETRADIIAIRRCDQSDEWLVLEFKTKMREHAAVQAKAALSRLGTDPMFQVRLPTARVFFVVKNRRKSDYTIMRRVGSLKGGEWVVTPQIVASGLKILC